MSATLLARRFGPSVAGWLVGFPFTSGPVSLFLTLEQGTAFAASAAVGSTASVVGQAGFALAYVASRRLGWLAATFVGTLAFASVGLVLSALDPPALVLGLLAASVLVVALQVMPAGQSAAGAVASPPRWDLASRAIVATVLVVTLTSLAPLVGPLVSGLASGFPVYATVLTVFAHRASGPEAAANVMRGLVAGLFGFASFFVVVWLALESLGPALGFVLAVLSVIAVQGVSLHWLRRTKP